MKKRKIFYFLKNREEYDYALLNNLIPKRGIVLIESTQEIYRNGIPYSGYSPLKQNFNELKSLCNEYTDSKCDAIQGSIREIINSINQINSDRIVLKYKNRLESLEEKIDNLENRVLDLELPVNILNSEPINYNPAPVN